MEFLHAKEKRKKLKGCGSCNCEGCSNGFKNHHEHLEHLIGTGKITGEQMGEILNKFHGSGFFDDLIHFFSTTGSTVASFIPFVGRPISMLWDKLPDIAETLSPSYHYPYRDNNQYNNYNDDIPTQPTPAPTPAQPAPAPKPTKTPTEKAQKYIDEYYKDDKKHYLGGKRKTKSKETAEERKKRMAYIRSFINKKKI